MAKSFLAANDIIPDELVLRNTDTFMVPSFAITTSSFPSPSMSAIIGQWAVPPAEKSTFVANDIFPFELRFLST